MKRDVHSKISFFASLRTNAKTILVVNLVIAAMLVGFVAGTLHASTLVTSDDHSLMTEAGYIIFIDDEGTVYAMNGIKGGIDYNSTDASYVINSVLEALPATGGCIFIKEGTYIISETIKVPSNTTLEGAGFSSKLALAPDTNVNIIENSDRANGNDNIQIKNLQLDGNKAENPAEMGGISFRKVRNSTIQNCWVHDVGYSGFLLYNGGGNIIQNNFVYKNKNAGIEGTHEDHDVVANNVVHSNEGIPYGYGIDYCTGSKYNIFEGNVCFNNGETSGGGLSLWDGFENTITSNTLTSNYVGLSMGIPTFGNKTSGNMIIGNMICNNTGDGLHLEGEINTVSKNIFSFNGGNGVYVNGSGIKNIIDGNRFESNQKWQIHITTLPSGTIIKNNFIFGDNLIKNQGTNTLIKWNTGYETEKCGTTVISAGQTRASFEHELVSTPFHVNLTPNDNLEGRSYWYTTNSTHITVHINSSDTGKDHSFNWSAEA